MPSRVSIELASPEDAPVLTAIQVRAFHSDSMLYPDVGESGPPGYDSIEETIRKIDEQTFYKIMAEGEIVGGITLFGDGPRHLHVDVLVVDPQHHNLGLGTRAMEFIETAHVAEVWTLDTPGYATRNHHFYERLGYVKVGEQTFESGFVLYNYRKEVTRSQLTR